MKALVLVTATLLAGATGCSSFDRLDFTFKSAPPDDAAVTFEHIRIHEGIALGVLARPMDDGAEMDEETAVVLESKNPAILGVAPGLPDDDDEDTANWSFVIFGVAAGETSVSVRVDGELESVIPATVEVQ